MFYFEYQVVFFPGACHWQEAYLSVVLGWNSARVNPGPKSQGATPTQVCMPLAPAQRVPMRGNRDCTFACFRFCRMIGHHNLNSVYLKMSEIALKSVLRARQ